MEKIAVIRLMPGQGGYYDDLSRIHLTVGSPVATVYAGTNCAQLRRSVKSGRLKLVSGSLGTETKPVKMTKTSTLITATDSIPTEEETKKSAKVAKTTTKTRRRSIKKTKSEESVKVEVIAKTDDPVKVEKPAKETEIKQEDNK